MTVAATESKFTLSKSSVPIGTVIFTVTNRGKSPHNFKIAGKTTRLLAPGQSTTLQVAFSKSGTYAYLSTVSGQAAAGMRGSFSVRAATVAPSPTTTPAVTTVGTANTRVVVEIYDPPTLFVLAPPRFPSGMVTFVITNHCVFLPNVCSFNLEGIHAGAHLNGGESETWTVALAPGVYHYHCDLAPGAMYGQFTVTP